MENSQNTTQQDTPINCIMNLKQVYLNNPKTINKQVSNSNTSTNENNQHKPFQSSRKTSMCSNKHKLQNNNNQLKIQQFNLD